MVDESSLATPSAEPPFPIVGLGASAGGLQALEAFFSHMPPQSHMAFVVVTHQHPGHTSLMPELLGKQTAMPVVAASSGMKVEPNRVYVAPAGGHLAILDRTLQVMEASTESSPRMPIDYFFRSLAKDQHELAIGVVLSGTGTDGTLGIHEIKGASGTVMVQEERSARYGGMPHSAIATEIADYVLPAEALPAQLVAHAAGARFAAPLYPGAVGVVPPAAIQQTFVLLRNRTGHNFSSYKATTIRRRIERRMSAHHIDSYRDYVGFLHANPAELDLLFKELLIGVTSFFRDPEAFEILGERVLPQMLASRSDNHVIRVWIAGCSTGEEAYSLAIALRECMEQSKRHLSVQIFATDLDHTAIDTARAGLYPARIAADVSPQRLERFFVEEEGNYRIKKDIREMLVFAPQNLIEDPPFTKLDVISCRNLLIYLNTDLQRRLFPLFHYALRPGGVLFLGSSETTGSNGALFEVLESKWKIFTPKAVATGSYMSSFPPTTPLDGMREKVPAAPVLAASNDASVARMAERLLLDQLAPPTALVRERGDVVHIHGHTGKFLEPAPGTQSTVNIFDMAREGLQLELGSAIRQAASRTGSAIRRGVRVRANGGWVAVDLRVKRIVEPEAFRGLYLVAFEHVEAAATPPVIPDGEPDEEGAATGRIAEIQRELQYTKESHQSTVEELETANEELKSTNERASIDERRASERQRRARDFQGGDAVAQRGAADRQRRAPGQARRAVAGQR